MMAMNFKELVLTNRSYRRFDESHTISLDVLRDLVELARNSASGRNAQPLRYIISSDRQMNAIIFGHLAWAAYLRDWSGPVVGERPSGYIIILGDTQITEGFGIDHGIAVQTILLGATAMGLGGCMLGSIQKPPLREALSIPDRYEILLVVALGKPVEKVVVEDVQPDGDFHYWRDDNLVHHVPKRTMKDILLDEY
jgi:nitroreductase